MDYVSGSQLSNEANEWRMLESGTLIHNTALIGFKPMRSPSFAREPGAWYSFPQLSKGVVVGPYAILYSGCGIGENTQICPYAHIREGAKIGRDCVIGVNVKIGFDAEIGDNCQLMDDVHVSGGTKIGNRCFISVHALMVNDDKPKGYVWKGISPVTIGDDVVLGAGCKLRPGIEIGDGSLVAMGAVVTRNVPKGSLVKGIPAAISELR